MRPKRPRADRSSSCIRDNSLCLHFKATLVSLIRCFIDSLHLFNTRLIKIIVSIVFYGFFLAAYEQQKLEPVLQTKIVPIAPRGEMSNYTCSSCSQPILERYLLWTQDRLSRGHYWHLQCLRCECCDVVLANVASTFYTKDNALLCKSDYMK